MTTVLTKTLSDNIKSSCFGMNHCASCHKGYIFYVCEGCDEGYGVNTKYFSNDECVYCQSVIPHCEECSNPIDAWNCSKCEDGYKLVKVSLHDDICVIDQISLEILN
jgi:hypothetical protein